MSDKKDEIISMQLELIRQMTEQNIRRLSDDIWGKTDKAANIPSRNEKVSNSRASDKKVQFGNPLQNTAANNKQRDNLSDRKEPLSDVIDSNTNKGSGAAPLNLRNSSSEFETGHKRKTDSAFYSPEYRKAGTGTHEGGEGEQSEKTEAPEDLNDLMRELDSYTGLESVKKEVRNLVNIARVYKLRRDNDLPVTDISLHMVFSGNPGTGKTMIARFMARVYHSIGLLDKGHLIEVDRSGLVAGYIGQTAMKSAAVLESARGGVLFIDEAYTLSQKGENDFGGEAIDTILKFMEDHRDEIVVIVAGYTELMETFIESNPGLRSRFNKYIKFEDYTADEMMEIFMTQCKKGFYTLDDSVDEALIKYFSEAAKLLHNFGNARGVRNTFEKILSEQANRLALKTSVSREELMKITMSDVKCALNLNTKDSENPGVVLS